MKIKEFKATVWMNLHGEESLGDEEEWTNTHHLKKWKSNIMLDDEQKTFAEYDIGEADPPHCLIYSLGLAGGGKRARQVVINTGPMSQDPPSILTLLSLVLPDSVSGLLDLYTNNAEALKLCKQCIEIKQASKLVGLFTIDSREMKSVEDRVE